MLKASEPAGTGRRGWGRRRGGIWRAGRPTRPPAAARSGSTNPGRATTSARWSSPPSGRPRQQDRLGSPRAGARAPHPRRLSDRGRRHRARALQRAPCLHAQPEPAARLGACPGDREPARARAGLPGGDLGPVRRRAPARGGAARAGPPGGARPAAARGGGSRGRGGLARRPGRVRAPAERAGEPLRDAAPERRRAAGARRGTRVRRPPRSQRARQGRQAPLPYDGGGEVREGREMEDVEAILAEVRALAGRGDHRTIVARYGTLDDTPEEETWQSAELLFEVGRAFGMLGNEEKLERYLLRCAELAPRRAAVFHCAIGWYFQRKKKWTKALRWYDRALASFPTYHLCLFRRGYCLEKLHRPREAVD